MYSYKINIQAKHSIQYINCSNWIILDLDLEDAKGVIRRRKLNKNRQYNGKMKAKRTNNDLQNTTQLTKDRAAQIPQKTRRELKNGR